ncbi:MAG: hypothetical protein V4623_01530 [Pseudomonadota bacterium]
MAWKICVLQVSAKSPQEAKKLIKEWDALPDDDRHKIWMSECLENLVNAAQREGIEGAVMAEFDYAWLDTRLNDLIPVAEAYDATSGSTPPSAVTPALLGKIAELAKQAIFADGTLGSDRQTLHFRGVLLSLVSNANAAAANQINPLGDQELWRSHTAQKALGELKQWLNHPRTVCIEQSPSTKPERRSRSTEKSIASVPLTAARRVWFSLLIDEQIAAEKRRWDAQNTQLMQQQVALV